jgi:hypothetical protein
MPESCHLRVTRPTRRPVAAVTDSYPQFLG